MTDIWKEIYIIPCVIIIIILITIAPLADPNGRAV